MQGGFGAGAAGVEKLGHGGGCLWQSQDHCGRGIDISSLDAGLHCNPVLKAGAGSGQGSPMGSGGSFPWQGAAVNAWEQPGMGVFPRELVGETVPPLPLPGKWSWDELRGSVKWEEGFLGSTLQRGRAHKAFSS